MRELEGELARGTAGPMKVQGSKVPGSGFKGFMKTNIEHRTLNIERRMGT
jgi:hypothetical protein